MLHLVGRLISIKYAAICNRENIAKFLIFEKRAVLSTPLFALFLTDSLKLGFRFWVGQPVFVRET